MSLPSVTDYHDAVQSPSKAFSDPTLRAGTLATNALGLPMMLGGGLAITYRVRSGVKEYAVRCFHQDAPGLASRYAQISRALQGLKSPSFVAFEYQAAGILVRGQQHPIVRMDWVDGQTLDAYLRDNLSQPTKIAQLRTRFAALEKHLRSQGIAHGDLQNLNVIVQNDDIRLIDYDGMYVPGMTAGTGSEVGHKAFQHPGRTTRHFGPEIDRFSFIAIDLGLEALQHRPTLFHDLKHGGEAIVFSATDYANPNNSAAFDAVRAIPSLKDKADRLAAIATADMSLVPTLDDYLSGQNIPRLVATAASVTSARPANQYIGAHPVLDGADYDLVLRQVGERVELVGKIVSVKEGVGRRGRGRGQPYVFVNFGPWNRQSVKITLWSDGLQQVKARPNQSWVGKWVSVTGLIEPPYHGSFRGNAYSSVGITISSEGQIVHLDEKAARLRLATVGQSASKPAGAASNQAVLQRVRAGAPLTSKTASGPSRPTAPVSSNAAVIAALKASSPSSSPAPSFRTPPRYPSTAPRTSSGSSSWFWTILIIGGLLFLASQCGA